MARLVLINGAPGTGKSTLARRAAAVRPLTVVLDLDLLRSTIGDWRARTVEAGVLARRMALAAIEVALKEGHDVLVPQLLARDGFVLELAALADGAGAPFTEVLLTAPPELAAARVRARGAGVEAADPAEPPPSYADAIERMTAARPGTVRIATDGSEDEALAALLRALGS